VRSGWIIARIRWVYPRPALARRRAPVPGRRRPDPHPRRQAHGGQPAGHRAAAGASPWMACRTGTAGAARPSTTSTGMHPSATASPSSTSTGDCPPGYNRGKATHRADLVLLVNGIPLVVVECKSPACPSRWPRPSTSCAATATSARPAYEVDDNEGNEPLFHTNQLLIATSFDEARVGSISAAFEHYAAWKTVVGPTAGHRGRGGRRRWARPSSPSRSGWWPACCARAPAGRVRHFTLFMHRRRADHQVGLPLPAVPRRQPRHPSPAHRQDPAARTASTTGAAASSGTPRARARA
jgi:hypothetical protein